MCLWHVYRNIHYALPWQDAQIHAVKKCSHDQLWHQLNSLTAQGHVEQPNALLRQDTSPGGVGGDGSERGRDHRSLSPFSTTKMAWWFVLCQFERECLIDNPCLAIIILMSIWMDERRQAKKRERLGGGCNMKRESEDWGEWKLNGSGATARLLKRLSFNPRLSYDHMSACCSYRCWANQILTSATGQNWPVWPFRHYILESGQAAHLDCVLKKMISGGQWGQAAVCDPQSPIFHCHHLKHEISKLVTTQWA